MADSCPHSHVMGKRSTIPLFGEETMPVDTWLCVVCKKRFRPALKTPLEKLTDWIAVVRLRKAMEKFRGEN